MQGYCLHIDIKYTQELVVLVLETNKVVDLMINLFFLHFIVLFFNPTLGGGVDSAPPHEFFDCSALKDSKKWGSWGMKI